MTSADARITVLLADDNLLVREGVRALLRVAGDLDVVAMAEDYDSLVTQAQEHRPQVVVTDIRMPPRFANEGIEAAKEVRKRLPGTGIVVLSQYDDPEYAVALLAQGAAGYAYLLKERVADGDRLARAVREVAAGGSMLDPEIVQALVTPARGGTGLSADEEQLLTMVAEGRAVKAIAASLQSTPEAVDHAVEELFLHLARDASSGVRGALERLRKLHTAILEREEQGETLTRLLPSGLAEKLRDDPGAVARTERLVVTVLMSDVRGYSGIAERTDPSTLARQLNAHRRAMNGAILDQGGTVMQYVGDAVMAVFGAPFPQVDHAERALRAAADMHRRQTGVDAQWTTEGLEPFGMGIGLSTGEVAAALLGSDERLEYTLVGDTVNMAQRLQDLARPAGSTVVSEATAAAAPAWTFQRLDPVRVKGRDAAVTACRVLAPAGADTANDVEEYSR
ncbi:adenylate/guanylate cyclase domain-containing protein [Jiangella mangrovi]|uniref:Class 3 adenylate cyclase/DNA-binding NarL/FixJ family response regulator n=1 Tax=Jiangella mangrovi TaxID=1524084 RepID=A0A7W9GQQ4_9ACTN|nr:adenylate/guanylate cyclase domain-containing protein [Jiangella mangrovi]MBB5788152.1 class 3 adenylate cyclase/DNA-binding NarL/FixJ family response regulator [Jiangella mangrovi]